MKTKTHQSFYLLLCLLLLSGAAFSQDEEIAKKITKAQKLAADKKLNDAEKLLTETLKKYPDNGDAWDALTGIQLKVLEEKAVMDNLFENVTITAKDKKGNVIKDDSLVTAMVKLMQSMKPSDIYKRHMINTYRWACCQTWWAYRPSFMTRLYLVDPDLYKEIKPDAMKEFYKAEEEFEKKNYNSAANYYQKAIDIDPGFYKARLYLGDVYYFTKHADLAIAEFKKAVAAQPNALEPRKYLSDALMQSGEYEKAFKVGVEAMAVYPDFSMMGKLQTAAHKAGIKMNMHWQQRDVLPNTVEKIEFDKDDFKLETPEKSPWKFYSEALNKVKAHCDKNGLIKPNDVTNEKYLELYSWKYMLQKTDTTQFRFAREMQKRGFLDCYVFVSCFHYNFYPQYLDFVAANKDRITAYFEELKKVD